MPDAVADCLFCRIVAGEIPADVVRSTDDTVAFRDVDPQAPTHVLVIPRAHYSDVGALVSDPQLTARLLSEAAAVAAELGHEQYRLVLNTGVQAGQSVFHVHAHVLAGRDMRWPPG